jgi:ABC-2 type transport system permease protein
MIRAIAWKECKRTWRDGRFRWTAGVVLCLFFTSLLVGFHAYSRRAQAIKQQTEAQRQQWLHKRAVNAHVAAHAGTTLFRPLNSLVPLDPGVDDYLGASVYLEPHRRNQFAHSPAGSVSLEAQSGELTAAVTLQTFLPLLIVLLTFSAFAGEREQGTLAHVLSVGVKPSHLLVGKAIGITVPLLVVIVPAMVAGVAFSSIRESGVDTARIVMLVAGYLSYLFILTGIGLFVSIRSKSSTRALTFLLGFWLVTSFAAPRLAFAIAERYAPAPTPKEFTERLAQAGTGDGRNFGTQRAEIERRLLAQYGVQAATDLPLSTWGMTLYEREVESTKAYNNEFARLFDCYARQQQLVDWVSIAFPPLALRTLSMAMAGTDVAHFRHFAEAAEEYRYAMVQRMNWVAVESRLYNSSPTFADGPDQPAFPQGEELAYASVEPFSYQTPGGWWAISGAKVPAFTLLVWVGGTVMAVRWALRRIEVQ